MSAIKHPVKIVAQRDIAVGTTAFYFERPQDFEFKGGQFLELTLINPPETDAKGNTRPFSIASAPHESNLMIATRVRDSAFKRVLKNLSLGTEVIIDGPMGNFVLHSDVSRPAVILAGGIGITPFRSMILQSLHTKKPRKFLLIFSNHTPESAPFMTELKNAAAKHKNFKLIENWSEKGKHIDRALLEDHLPPNDENPVFYLAGPSLMVGAMHKLLNSMKIDDDNIRLEEFTGY